MMSGFKEIYSERLKEKVLYTRHKSGLDIYIEPKRGYSSQYAIFGTKYGSIDNRFTVGGETLTVPEGIAHYLEHKLFESEDGDAFSRYAKTGASANAYTSFDRTCYLFSSTSKFTESLEILLDFVQHPYFTQQTVQKEQGIIGQEIKMYDDDPDWRVLFNLLGALYHTHPVKIDIAGTVESISHITPELLYKCYDAFYNLGNMVLCIAGDVNPDDVIAVADKVLKPAKPQQVKSIFEPEPETIVKPRVEQKLSVSVPMFNFGFKDSPSEGKEFAKNEALTSIILEAVCGEASPLYRRLYDSELISNDFSAQYFNGRSFACTIFGGVSNEPDKVMDEFLKETERLKKDGMNKEDFEAAKRTVYGRMAVSYDNIDNVANNIAGCRFMDMGPFDTIDAVADADYDSAQERLTKIFAPERCAMSVILPIKQA
jgi:predicted Zn-dependent peptidase